MAGKLDPRATGAQRLKNKVCIVTGSGQGIGRATAKRLGEEGGKIVIGERVEESATRTLAELLEHGVDAIKVLADLSTAAGARTLMSEAVKAYGRVDVLVNNVGGTIWWKRYHDYTEEKVQLELERSLYPTLWCCLAVLPIMLQQKSGSIVNVASSVTRGGRYRGPYAVSKGGVEALTRVLAMEYGRYGIRVNAISPGGTAIPDRITPRLLLKPGVMAAHDNPEDAKALNLEAREDMSYQAIKRQALPEEQASVIAFLACEDASFVTGQIISVSGGP